MSSKTKKPCHLFLSLKYGYLLYGLLLTAILSTCAYLSSEFGILGYIRSITGLATYIYVFCGIIIASLIFYYVYRAKTRHVSFADSFCIAGTLSPVLIALYVKLVLNSTKSTPYIILGCVFLINFIFLIIFLCRRDEKNQKKNILFTENSFLGYFTNVFRKYRFLGIFTIAILTIALTYLFFNKDFSSLILDTIQNYPAMRILIIVSAELFILFVITDSIKKRVSIIDALLISNIVSMPITLMQIIFVNGKENTQFCIWAVIVGLLLIATLIRFLSFDVTINYEQKDSMKKCYFTKLFREYNPLLILFVASIITTILYFGYTSDVYKTSLEIVDGVLTKVVPDFFPMSLLTTASGLTIVIGLIFSIIGINKKGVCFIDFVTVLNLILGIVALVGLMLITSKIYMIVAISFTAVNLILFIVRACIVKRQKNIC